MISTIWKQPITDASAWRGADLQQDRSWEYTLSEPQVEALDRALRQIQRDGLQLAEITPDRFPLLHGPDATHSARLSHGRGLPCCTLSG